jgi:hypothetical protein
MKDSKRSIDGCFLLTAFQKAISTGLRYLGALFLNICSLAD